MGSIYSNSNEKIYNTNSPSNYGFNANSDNYNNNEANAKILLLQSKLKEEKTHFNCLAKTLFTLQNHRFFLFLNTVQNKTYRII